MSTSETESRVSNWAEKDRFLGLRDERPVITNGLVGLGKAFEHERKKAGARLVRIGDELDERLAKAADALEASHAILSQTFHNLEDIGSLDRRVERRVAAELESQLAKLYRQVRLGPGRAMDRVHPRRFLLSLLDDMKASYAVEVEKFPANSFIIKTRGGAPRVPAGERVCDVHPGAIALGMPSGGMRLFLPLKRLITKYKLWTRYEILQVPVRDIVKDLVLGPTALKAPVLADDFREVHAKAKADLEEGWQVVRSNIEVTVDELQQPPEATENEEEQNPADRVSELGEIVLGALERSKEKIQAISTPYKEFITALMGRIEQDQIETLDRIQHDIEKSEKISVRLAWARRRAAVRLAHWYTAITRTLRHWWKRFERLIRRGYYRAEDITLRLGKAIGVDIGSEQTLLAFADLPQLEDIEERVKSLPPIYRRLFSRAPLRTRELMVGRDDFLNTLAEITERWREGRPSSVAVIGPEGSGKTSLLNCYESELDSSIPIVRFEISKRLHSVQEILDLFCEWFEIEEHVTNFEKITEHIVQLPPRVVIIEGGHYLRLRAMGAGKVTEAFMSMILATRARVLWIVTVRLYPWRRMDDHLNVSQYFTHTMQTPFHSIKELKEALLLRHRSSGLGLHFSENGIQDRKLRKLLLSHPADSEIVQDTLRSRYFENLFGAGGGNMDSALFYWLTSLSSDEDGERLIVSDLQRPDATFIQKFDRVYLFTLAEILNNGTLTVPEHAAIFRLSELRSRIILNYLHQLNLIQITSRGTDTSPPQYKINPVFWHLVSSTLESMSILY